MIEILSFLLIISIVGFVTAGLNIKFDRFFTILLLLFIMKLTIFKAVNLFLWIILFGALMIILNNAKKIGTLPKKMKMKLFILIPIFTLVATWFGSYLFSIASSSVLLIVLGVLAVLYGIRLIVIHFEPHEMDLENASPVVTKICGLFGPIISGFFIGIIGTSLKPLKMAFAIKIGKMNAKQVYLGNTITTFFASSFAIMWHYIFSKGIEHSITSFYGELLLGAALWTGIHYMFEVTNLFFKNKWRKPFQMFIGVILLLVSIKVFMQV